ncbi:glutathione S-transferase [Mycena metata]|uniref:glutathione transferase n=1 Tax=Mycena metata TaxID=1033252 RepID=A0AAD7IQU7_9AGAR|nr:glutathione S-transferase [Mycena metata]
MAILKLHGSKLATCTRRVGTVLHELKVPFELVEVGLFKGEQKTPEYLEKQPFGQIPYITRAICRYIAAKHPESGLIPAEPKANALFEQAAAAEAANFDPGVSEVGVEYFKQVAPMGWMCEQEIFGDRHGKLDAYEVILSKHRYMAGDTLTLADLFHLPYAWLVTLGGSDIMTRRPNVARWYQELISRPSWLAFVDGVKTTETY